MRLFSLTRVIWHSFLPHIKMLVQLEVSCNYNTENLFITFYSHTNLKFHSERLHITGEEETAKIIFYDYIPWTISRGKNGQMDYKTRLKLPWFFLLMYGTIKLKLSFKHVCFKYVCMREMTTIIGNSAFNFF